MRAAAGAPRPVNLMKIIRAEHLGMCFGVKDAIALALETARHEPLTILGDLVQNETVLAELRAGGVRFGQAPAGVTTPAVMVTAHGASEPARFSINDLRAGVITLQGRRGFCCGF